MNEEQIKDMDLEAKADTLREQGLTKEEKVAYKKDMIKMKVIIADYIKTQDEKKLEADLEDFFDEFREEIEEDVRENIDIGDLDLEPMMNEGYC